jgi:hypothetical protein
VEWEGEVRVLAGEEGGSPGLFSTKLSFRCIASAFGLVYGTEVC